MTIDVSLIPQNRVENLISKLSEIENNIGNIGTDITNNVVHKSGNETISGTKTFNNAVYCTNNNAYYQNMSGYTLGTVPSSNYYPNSLTLNDSKGQYFGFYGPEMLTDGSYSVRMGVRSQVNSKSYSILKVGFLSNGSMYTSAPTPPASNNSTQIATTNWCYDPAKSTNLVHRSGDETITGTKTFNNEIIFNDIPVFNGGKNDSTEGGEIHIASTPNKGWDKDTTIIDEQDGGIRFFNFKNNQVYGYRFDLNDGKGLPKARMVVDAYKSGTSWYRVWSDGWIEQGGQTPKTSDAFISVSFAKAFSQDNPNVQFTRRFYYDNDATGCQNRTTGVSSVTTTGFKCYDNGWSSAGGSVGVWYACGY